MFGWHKISSTDHIAAGKNVNFRKHNGKVIISADNTDTTTVKVGVHKINGEFIEIEAGDGIIINTISPNKLKITLDAYKFFGNHELLTSLVDRITRLEAKER